MGVVDLRSIFLEVNFAPYSLPRMTPGHDLAHGLARNWGAVLILRRLIRSRTTPSLHARTEVCYARSVRTVSFAKVADFLYLVAY